MPSALIIGGGLAGIIAGVALRKAGWDPVVYDDANARGGPDPDHFLTLAVNGFDALAAVNAEDAVKNLGIPTAKFQFSNAAGKRLGSMPSGPRLSGGRIARTFRKSELHVALCSLAERRGVRIVHCKTVTHAETANDHAAVTFLDGSTAQGDILIGADGMHSTVRRLIDSKAPMPRATGNGYTFGVAHMAGRVAAAAGEVHVIWGRRRWFKYIVTPSGDIWWSACHPLTHELSHGELAHSSGAVVSRTQVRSFFDGDTGPARDIITATNGDPSVIAQYHIQHIPVLHRGRMTLIGDAGHALQPTTAQSVAQIAESAVILAQCLRDFDEPNRAFKLYASVRRKRTEGIKSALRLVNDPKSQGWFARALRDAVTPWVMAQHSSTRGTAPYDWIFRHHIEWNSSATDSAPPIASTERG